ncbi:MAG: hypothetical protein NWQ46_09175 [Spirosomaceae bacterium]|nr:hypothetical protein [Spirosomataceae bacterium]
MKKSFPFFVSHKIYLKQCSCPLEVPGGVPLEGRPNFGDNLLPRGLPRVWATLAQPDKLGSFTSFLILCYTHFTI